MKIVKIKGILALLVVAIVSAVFAGCGSDKLQFGEWVVLQEATCLEEGMMVRYAQKDESVFETQIIPALGHNWVGENDGWVVIEEPTYTTEGFEQRVCSRCNHQETRIIDMLIEPTHLNVMDGNTLLKKIYVDADGNYDLADAGLTKVGYTFVRFYGENNRNFPVNGTITETQNVYTEWEIIPTTTFAQLAEYAAAGVDKILLAADITITQSVYVVGQTEIYVQENYTLTRDANFDGDLFVIGETEDGQNTQIINGRPAVLTLKREGSATLTIDGNKEHVAVNVVGTAFMILHSAELNMYEGVTIQNCKKVANEKTLESQYALSYPDKIGGAAVIVASGTFNMYGGALVHNEVNIDETDTGLDAEDEDSAKVSSCGGAIYNNSNVNIYAGVFQDNQAARGGVIYNYRTTRIHGGEFKNNQAGVYGGAIYLPNSQYAQLFIGEEDAEQDSIVFEANSAVKSGGVIFGQMKNSVTIYGGVIFHKNTAINSNGGVINTSGALIIYDATFSENQAASKGGAIYVYYSNDELTTRQVDIKGGLFSQNKAAKGGAIGLSASSSDFGKGTIGMIGKVTFQGNQALESLANGADTDNDESSSTDGNGGAIYIARHSDVTINGAIFQENYADVKGGVVYVTGGSRLTVAASTFENNNATGNGGAIYAYTDTELTVSDSDFNDNVSANRGGAIYLSGVTASITGGTFDGNQATKETAGAIGVYSSSTLTIDGTEFTNNSAKTNGGAIYYSESTSTITGALFNGNTATGTAGAIGVYSATTLTITDTEFTNNTATTNGGALYFSGSSAIIDGATFNNNQASGTGGGAIYATSAATIRMKDVTATGNNASKGGFLYFTTTDTKVYIYSAKLSENKAASAADGNDFWGNSDKAYLYLEKAAIESDDGTVCGKYTLTENIEEEWGSWETQE